MYSLSLFKFQCTYVQAALNAANAGTHALENAANSTLGVIADLNTMMIFASAGTLENDDESETFAGTALLT
jgi:talin